MVYPAKIHKALLEYAHAGDAGKYVFEVFIEGKETPDDKKWLYDCCGAKTSDAQQKVLDYVYDLIWPFKVNKNDSDEFANEDNEVVMAVYQKEKKKFVDCFQKEPWRSYFVNNYGEDKREIDIKKFHLHRLLSTNLSAVDRAKSIAIYHLSMAFIAMKKLIRSAPYFVNLKITTGDRIDFDHKRYEEMDAAIFNIKRVTTECLREVVKACKAKGFGNSVTAKKINNFMFEGARPVTGAVFANSKEMAFPDYKEKIIECISSNRKDIFYKDREDLERELKHLFNKMQKDKDTMKTIALYKLALVLIEERPFDHHQQSMEIKKRIEDVVLASKAKFGISDTAKKFEKLLGYKVENRVHGVFSQKKQDRSISNTATGRRSQFKI